MKTLTYAAAIALLTASAAFAQSTSNNSSMTNNPTPTPTMSGPAEGSGGSSSQSSSTMQNSQDQAPSMDQSKSGMDQSGSGTDQSSAQNSNVNTSHHVATRSRTSHHVASRGSSGMNSRENRETAQLNRQQISGGGMNEGMSANMAGGGNNMHRNPFNNGSPQQAQAGGANCTPDRPDCGTARQNPAIKSSPQQRTYNASPQ